jgi:ssDNA-binding Zn-finger/Zn-ribbon topoisomerase 1
MTRNVRAKVRPAACPTCGSALIEKKIGTRPAFWSCVRYGAAERPCTYAERGDAAAVPTPAATPSGGPTPPRTRRSKRETAAGPAAPRARASRAGAAPARARRDAVSPTAAATAAPGRGVPVRWTRSATDRTCPRCTRDRLALVSPVDPASGAPFYACEDATCTFTLPLGASRHRLPCPRCGAMVVERRRPPDASGAPGERYWCCARWPECGHATPMASAPPPTTSAP